MRRYDGTTLVGAAVTGVVAFFLCWPIFRPGWFHSHEGTSYVVRTAEFMAGLGEGDPWPRWVGDFYGGLGSPFFDYYAPAVYGIAARIGFYFGTTPETGLKSVIVLTTVLGGVGTYLLVFEETYRLDAALLASILFLFAPYRTADTFTRGDLSESLALALIPVTLLLYRRIETDAEPLRLLAVGFAASCTHALAMTSHALIGFWGTVLAAVVVGEQLLTLVERRAWLRLRLLVASGLGAGALAVSYYAPAFLEMRLVRIDDMTLGYHEPLQHLLSFQDLLGKGPLAYTDSRVVIVLLAVAMLCLLWRQSRRPLAYALPACVALVLCTFPSQALYELRVFNVLRIVQFPWRFVGPLVLFGAITVGLAWATLVRQTRQSAPLPVVAVTVLCAIAVWHGLEYVAINPMPEGSYPSFPDEIRAQMIHTTGVNEYLPRTAHPPAHPAPRLVSSGVDAAVEVESRGMAKHTLKVDTSRASVPVQLELNLHYFPGWTARGATIGALVVSPSQNAPGRVAVTLPPGLKGETVQVRYAGTHVQIFAERFALLAFLSWLPLSWTLLPRTLRWHQLGRWWRHLGLRARTHGHQPA